MYVIFPSTPSSSSFDMIPSTSSSPRPVRCLSCEVQLVGGAQRHVQATQAVDGEHRCTPVDATGVVCRAANH